MAKIIETIPVFGNPIDERALAQLIECRRDAVACALMADHHLGYQMPIGGVAAYDNQVPPAGAGFDIACGNKAVRLDVGFDDIKDWLDTLMDDIWRSLSFGIGRVNEDVVEDPLFDDPAWREVNVLQGQALKQKARNQLGTIGSGNHYVDLFRDEKDRIWVGVHFGSRGLGHSVATEFMKLAGSNPNASEGAPKLLPADKPVGEDYLRCMELAGRYASAGRSWVCAKVAGIIGGHIVEEVHNHHNYVWKETHQGRSLYVARKGATPAYPGQKGFVGGSMGDDSVILEGVEGEEAKQALYSTVHGAGRVMSRTKAAGKMNYKTRRREGGEVTRVMMKSWLKEKGVRLRGAGVDEAPQVYKRLSQVLEHHAKSVKVLHTLRPLGVCMAAEDEKDPYKD